MLFPSSAHFHSSNLHTVKWCVCFHYFIYSSLITLVHPIKRTFYCNLSAFIWHTCIAIAILNRRHLFASLAESCICTASSVFVSICYNLLCKISVTSTQLVKIHFLVVSKQQTSSMRPLTSILWKAYFSMAQNCCLFPWRRNQCVKSIQNMKHSRCRQCSTIDKVRLIKLSQHNSSENQCYPATRCNQTVRVDMRSGVHSAIPAPYNVYFMNLASQCFICISIEWSATAAKFILPLKMHGDGGVLLPLFISK